MVEYNNICHCNWYHACKKEGFYFFYCVKHQNESIFTPNLILAITRVSIKTFNYLAQQLCGFARNDFFELKFCIIYVSIGNQFCMKLCSYSKYIMCMKTKLSNYVLHAKSINMKDFNILGQYGVNKFQ